MEQWNKKSVFIALVVLTSIIVLSVFAWFFGNGTLEISIPATANNSRSVQVTLTGPQSSQTLTLKPGETKRVRLSTGYWRVDSAADTVRSIDVVKVGRLFSTTRLATPTGEARQINQVATGVESCVTNPQNLVFSYRCNSSGPVIKHVQQPSGRSVNTQMFKGESFDVLRPTKDGLVGISKDRKHIEFLNLIKETKQNVSLPNNISPDSATFDSSPYITTSGNSNDPRFVLVHPKDNNLYLYDGVDDKKPTIIKPLSDGVQLNNNPTEVYVTVSDNRVVVFNGSSNGKDGGLAEGDEGAAPVAKKPKHKGAILEYSFNGKLERKITLSENFEAHLLQKVSDSFYAAPGLESGFTFFWLNNGSLENILSLDSVKSWVTLNGEVYMQSGFAMYKFSPKQNGTFSLHSLFASDKMDISSISAGQEGVIINGFAGSGYDRRLNIYSLTDKPQTAGNIGHVAPGFYGLDLLINNNFDRKQSEAVRSLIEQYMDNTKIDTTRAEIKNFTPPSSGRYDFDSDGFRTAKFEIHMSGGAGIIKAELGLRGLDAIKLSLYDTTGNKLYDSGVVN